MDGDDEEDPGEYSPTSYYLIASATSFLCSLLRNDHHVKVSLLVQLVLRGIH